MIRRAATLLFVLPLLLSACAPSVEDISGATEAEIGRACRELRLVRWDYWSLSAINVSGRTLEVAAAIHTNHPGPEQVREYCQGR